MEQRMDTFSFCFAFTQSIYNNLYIYIIYRCYSTSCTVSILHLSLRADSIFHGFRLWLRATNINNEFWPRRKWEEGKNRIEHGKKIIRCLISIWVGRCVHLEWEKSAFLQCVVYMSTSSWYQNSFRCIHIYMYNHYDCYYYFIKWWILLSFRLKAFVLIYVTANGFTAWTSSSHK